MSGGHTLTDRTSSIRYEAWARNAVAFIRSKGLETEFSDWCGGWPVPVAGTEALIAAAPNLLEALEEMTPRGIDSDNANIPDDLIIPVDMIMGEIRRARAALAKARQSEGDQ